MKLANLNLRCLVLTATILIAGCLPPDEISLGSIDGFGGGSPIADGKAGGGAGNDNTGGGAGGGSSGTLTCRAGAYEPARPGSPYAFEIVRRYEKVGFRPQLTDQGQPVSTVTLDINGKVPFTVEPIFEIRGPANGKEFGIFGIHGSTVSPDAGAALIKDNTITLNAEGNITRGPLEEKPSMTWYLTCHGEADISRQTDAEFCAAYGFECGNLTATDNTGTLRSVEPCGTCPVTEVCRPKNFHSSQAQTSWKAQQCRPCVNETDAQLCQRLDKNCGTVSGSDDCDVLRTVECGTCIKPSFCGGGGEENICGG